MRFFLGTHKVVWLERTAHPLFLSRRWLVGRKRLPRSAGSWVLDSGAFTELHTHGTWTFGPGEYVRDVRQFESEVGSLEWVAPQDWMCEPFMVKRTGLSVFEHQRLTVRNFVMLRQALGELVIPVLQGWTLDEYLACWDEYAEAGVELGDEPLVGLGSICRRQDMAEAGLIVRRLAREGLRLHGFGVKITGLNSFGDVLVSADSMAWSYSARRSRPLPGCSHKSCSNCMVWALRWADQVGLALGQLRLEVSV